jgi:hypothetical protein
MRLKNMHLLKNLIFVLLSRKLKPRAEEPLAQLDDKKEVSMDNNSTKLHMVLFELGTLQVFATIMPKDYAENKAYTEFYWRDQASPQGFGPFKSVWDAVEHYKRMQIAFKGGEILPDGTVPAKPAIRVDFAGKKRV